MKSKANNSIMVLNLEVITPTPSGKATKTWLNILFSGTLADQWAAKVKEGDAIDVECHLSSQKNPKTGKWENTYFADRVVGHVAAPVAAPTAQVEDAITF